MYIFRMLSWKKDSNWLDNMINIKVIFKLQKKEEEKI